MTEENQGTEERIFEAAKNVFVKKGLNNSRMQEIAQEAGMNKALLHYYYRSKEKLFEAVFNSIMKRVIPPIAEMLEKKIPLFEKIEFIVDRYINSLISNPQIPVFFIQEIQRNPQRIVEIIKKYGLRPEVFFQQIEDEIKAGNIIDIKPQQLIVNLLSMCVFPFAARPVVQGMIFDNDKKKYDQFLIERKKEVSKFIINSIMKK
jgi:TetR/AcrR family transcriptional regulator